MLVDGYVRVSQVAGRSGERFISPAVQREQIVGWARFHQASVGRIFEELDVSGARADRPLLEEAILGVEAGSSDGIVVAKLDRFGRSLVDSLAGIERIQAANGTFVSVEDGLDLSTDTGKLVLRILFSLAEWELDRIRRSWETAREKAIARGVFMGARPPTGYRRGSGGRLFPHPHDGPMVTELFRRRAARASLKELCFFMEESGVLTPWGNSTWCSATLRDLFFNRAYLGEAHSGGFTKPGAHPALVDEDTFQLVQRPQTLKPPVGKQRPAVLTSLIRCAGCRCLMQNHPKRLDDGYVVHNYTCVRRHANGVCPAPTSATAASIESWVERALFERCPRRNPARNTTREHELRAKAARAEADLVRYRDSPRVLKALGPDSFADGLELRRRRAEVARLAVANLVMRQGRPQLPALREIERLWPTLTKRDPGLADR
jgi:DNA invertase Pin-like site-specific DNA recombinase